MKLYIVSIIVQEASGNGEQGVLPGDWVVSGLLCTVLFCLEMTLVLEVRPVVPILLLLHPLFLPPLPLITLLFLRVDLETLEHLVFSRDEVYLVVDLLLRRVVLLTVVHWQVEGQGVSLLLLLCLLFVLILESEVAFDLSVYFINAVVVLVVGALPHYVMTGVAHTPRDRRAEGDSVVRQMVDYLGSFRRGSVVAQYEINEGGVVLLGESHGVEDRETALVVDVLPHSVDLGGDLVDVLVPLPVVSPPAPEHSPPVQSRQTHQLSQYLRVVSGAYRNGSHCPLVEQHLRVEYHCPPDLLSVLS